MSCFGLLLIAGLKNVVRVYAGGDDSAALMYQPPYLKIWGKAVSKGILKLPKKPFTAASHQVALGKYGALLLDDRGKVQALGRCLPIPRSVANGTTYDVFVTGSTCWAHGQYKGQHMLYAWDPSRKFSKPVYPLDAFNAGDVLFVYPTQHGYLFIGTFGFEYYVVSPKGVICALTELNYKEISSMTVLANGDYYAVEVMENNEGNAYAVYAGNVFKERKVVKVPKVIASAVEVRSGGAYSVALLHGSKPYAFGRLRI